MFKDYQVPIVRILNQFQVILYISHGLKPIDVYVSKNTNDDYKLVYVFDREQSQILFNKFRNHELEIGSAIVTL